MASLIVQNGNAYVEGLREFWNPIRIYWEDPSAENAVPLAKFISPEGVEWQYTHGVRNPEVISPDNWKADLNHLTRAGNPEIQLALFYDYQNNVPHYPAWQAYFREHQPPTLIASLGDGVQRALGREPRDFAEVCRAAAASGVWKVRSPDLTPYSVGATRRADAR